MKKLLIVVLFSIFVVLPVSAQSRVDKFLGNWKMTKIESGAKDSTVNSLTMNVSLDGKEIKINQTAQGVNDGKDYNDTINSSYRLNGAASTQPAGGQFGGTLIRYMTVHTPGKIEFSLGLRSDSSPSSPVGMVAVELWTLSDDAKTLTIESRTRHSSSKTIFSKQ